MITIEIGLFYHINLLIDETHETQLKHINFLFCGGIHVFQSDNSGKINSWFRESHRFTEHSGRF